MSSEESAATITKEMEDILLESSPSTSGSGRSRYPWSEGDDEVLRTYKKFSFRRH